MVGGGITGLAAAHRLTGAGADVVAVESSPRFGGKVHTEQVDGFLVEAGPDSFVAAKQVVLELAAELGIEEEVISSRPDNRGSYVYSNGRLHALPEGLLLMAPSRLGPVLRSALLSWGGKLRLLGDLVLPRGGDAGDESLESFVERRLGHQVLERIAQPLVAGIHAAEPDTMSLAASFPRFLEMERTHRSLILAAKRAAREAPPTGGVSYFASFKDGMGALTAALLAALGDADLRPGAEVEGLSRSPAGIRLSLTDTTEITADAVILALPASAAGRLLASTSPEAAAAVSEIRQVSSAVVTLGYRTAGLPRLHGYGFVVPSVERRRITGVTYTSQKWDGRSPGPDWSLIRAFVGGADGQQLAVADHDRLVATARDELASLAGITAQPALVRSQSWQGGFHQYTLGHLERVSRAESALSAHPGLYLAGGAFHGIGLNECIDSGRRAADAALGFLSANQAVPRPDSLIRKQISS